MKDDGVPQQCITWKVKLPLKIKIFLWYLNKGVILTKDNLVKRQRKGNTSCSFCDTNETPYGKNGVECCQHHLWFPPHQ